MRAFIPQGSKDSSIDGGSVWTERETMLKNKSVLDLAKTGSWSSSELFSPLYFNPSMESAWLTDYGLAGRGNFCLWRTVPLGK